MPRRIGPAALANRRAQATEHAIAWRICGSNQSVGPPGTSVRAHSSCHRHVNIQVPRCSQMPHVQMGDEYALTG